MDEDLQIDVCEEPDQAEFHAENHRKAGRKGVVIKKVMATGLTVSECEGDKRPYKLASKYTKYASPGKPLYIVESTGA